MALAAAAWAEWRTEVADISALVSRQFGGRPIRVLEAGCGSASHLAFPDGSQITGVDISSHQLARNDRLTERILGDIQRYPLPDKAFQVIVCWDVLEHLDDPAAALDRFSSALVAGGLLVLGFPDRRSLKGWLTRALPYTLHVWVYRWLLGSKLAGTDDHGPFPTPMRPEMDRDAVVARMASHGFEPIKEVAYESPMVVGARDRLRLRGVPWRFVQRFVGSITGSAIDANISDRMLVLRKTNRTL